MTRISIQRSRRIRRAASIVSAFLVVLIMLAVWSLRKDVSADTVRVSIDVLPGKTDKTIDLSKHQAVPVVIYSTAGFDASSIDPATISISGAEVAKKHGKLRAYPRDLNGDGRDDLTVYVFSDSMQVSEGQGEASLTAVTFDGKRVTSSRLVSASRSVIAASRAAGAMAPQEPDPNGVVFNGGAITINDSATPPTQATPYPSTISVSGLVGVVGVVSVTLTNFSHAFPDDVDILLKGPTGANAIILSDVGGSIGVTNLTINLDDKAGGALPDAGPLTSGTFKPTNVGAGDTFPTQAPSGGSVLSAFNGTNPNGTWSLYVVDDANGQAGSIGSWSLNIATVTNNCNSAPITINTGGVAATYPSAITMSGLTANVAHATVTITGFSHNFATDVDMCLEGPTNNRALNDRTAIIWSDVGPNGPQASVNITLDDFAAANMPAGSALSSGTFKPTNADATPEIFPAPGPGTAPVAQVALSIFNGTNGNGTWNLWIKDDTAGDGGSISGGWCLTIAQGPTLARFLSASALVSGDGQLALNWQTGFEVDNLGFNVFRDVGGQRIRINKDLIAGSSFITSPSVALTAGRNYKWRGDAARDNQVGGDYWIEAVSVDGSKTLHGPVKSVYSPNVSDFQSPSSTLGNLGRNGNSPGRVNLQSVSVLAAPSGQTAFKVGVRESGIYRVNQSDLETAGFSPSIDARNLQLFEDGVERPIFVQGEQDGRLDRGDFIEFYGRAADTPYSDTHVYQLVAGSQPGLRISKAKAKSKSPPGESFLASAEIDDKRIYFPGFKNGEREKFFGAVISKELVERTLKLQHVATSATLRAMLEVHLQGLSTGSHNVNVRFNDADVGTASFTGQSPSVLQIDLPQSRVREGDNSIQFVAGETDVTFLGAVKLNYWHLYAADDNALQFDAAAGQRVSVSGFSSGGIRVLDITDAEKDGVREVNTAVDQSGNGYSITVNVAGAGQRTLLAVATDRIKNPASIAADIASSWRKKTNKADIVIFTRAEFMSALEPLKAHREAQGYTVAIVDIEDAFDEFSFGNKTPQAIKDFLANATTVWKVKPRFAIFAGDSSFDPKNYLGNGASDVIPTKLIETKVLETSSDDWFVDFDGDGLPEMSVGRLPVRSAEELSLLVAKIVAYDGSSGAQSVLLVSDSDNAFDFGKASVDLRTVLPEYMTRHEIDRSVMSDSTARSLLLDYLNSGQGIINYLGHGSVDIWRDNLLVIDDARALKNSRLSLFVSMTCLNGYFHDAATDSLAEAMLKARDGGAVAAWASSGMCDPGDQAVMNHEFYRLLFAGNGLTIGEAAMSAKSSVQDKDVRRTWILLGDPTTRLR